ncbi:MAG: Crp/Fnr family transcriptional regulator [Arcobacter sp.]|nr:MAG: Crp/Fnr family transcriptional regulator [Arcobacter sp.]
MELKNIYLFENLDDSIISKLKTISSIEELNKENILFYEGDESKYMYILLKGIIKLYKVTSIDKELVLKYFHENELIAEVANFEEINYPATAQAFTDIKVLKIDFKKFKEEILTNPTLSYLVMKSLITKIRNLENIVSMHLVLDSKERVAKYIHDHTEDFFNTKNVIVAEILNITPETLSRILRVFKYEKLIDTKEKIINKDGLKAYFA